MASPPAKGQPAAKSRSQSALKMLGIFQRHELKILNLGLVIYLCFGVVVFELLGEFKQPDRISDSGRSRPGNGSAAAAPELAKKESHTSSLAELRELSARRMWNITNRLNILYESNWTRLMLDELREFERQLLERLLDEAAREQRAGERQSEQQDDDNDDDDDDKKDSDADKEKKKKKTKRRSERESENRLKSLRKSLVHSLSTITTVGFAQQVQSSAAKLATVIYGLVGIPLLVCSVAKTGKQVAHSTRNGLLIVRHYCFSLPAHYLCCSCSLGACFRCLLWCCCCCCCSYLFCCLPPTRGGGGSSNNKSKCCDPSRAPKLKLAKRKSARDNKSCKRRSPGGATSLAPDHQQQSAFVIGAPSMGNGGGGFQQMTLDRAPEQKSVRFSKTKKSKSEDSVYYDDDDDDGDDDKDDRNDEEDFSYTQGVFFTSVSALSLYLLLGAYFYSTYTNSSLIDALFVCYSMLSTSKFPGQTTQNSDQIYPNPLTLYENLNATTTTTSTTLAPTRGQPSGLLDESIQSETVQWIYLLIGLNLISACGHFAQLWLSNKLRLEECPGLSSSKNNSNKLRSICNGQMPVHSLAGSFQAPPANQQLAASAPTSASESVQVAPNKVGQIMTPAGYTNLANHQHNIYQPQPQPQVDLSELFLVQNQSGNSPDGMHQFMSANQMQQQQQQRPVGQTPDMSLSASERSTDRGSLCQHHQLVQRHAHQSARPSAGESGALYARAIYDGSSRQQQHHRHPSQTSHLYLPDLNCIQQRQLGGQFVSPNSIDCDESDEMELMLKSCVGGSAPQANKLRASSSSTQLSGPIRQHHHLSFETTNNGGGTMLRVGSSFDNKQDGGHEGDSTNEGSNTISSTTSSRTVKVPHLRSSNQQQQQQHIGFILAPEHQRPISDPTDE